MTNFRTQICTALSLAETSSVALAQPTCQALTLWSLSTTTSGPRQTVYFGLTVKTGAFGKFVHGHELTPIDKRGIIRPNRDTLYSFAVFDFDASPVPATRQQRRT